MNVILILSIGHYPGISEIVQELQLKIEGDPTQKDNYIGANQEFTRCRNHHNILALSLLSSPLLHHEAHPHLSKSNFDYRVGEGWLNAYLFSNPCVIFIGKLMTKLPLWPNTTKMAKLGSKSPKQPVALTHPSSASSPRDLCDDATCTMHPAPLPVLSLD
jgi:hypothetical protein